MKHHRLTRFLFSILVSFLITFKNIVFINIFTIIVFPVRHVQHWCSGPRAVSALWNRNGAGLYPRELERGENSRLIHSEMASPNQVHYETYGSRSKRSPNSQAASSKRTLLQQRYSMYCSKIF